MENNPYRKIQLLGIAHPIVGKKNSSTGGASGDD